MLAPLGNEHGSSGVTGVPQRLLTGKFLLTYREKIGKEKMGNWV